MPSNVLIDLKRYLFLTRPYSWISVAFAVVLANLVVNKSVNQEWIIVDVVFAISTWMFCNLLAESFSKDMHERGKVHILAPLVLFIVSFWIMASRNIGALPFYGIIIVSLLIYGLKNKSRFIGPISFFIRGLMEVNLFIITLIFYNFNFNDGAWLAFAIVVYCITCARNLVGDIRDVEFDKSTLPKSLGSKAASFVVWVVYLLALLVFPAAFFSLAVAIILVTFLRDAYTLHRILVVVNTFVLLDLCLVIIAPSLLILSNLILIGVLLNYVYNFVPRKSNPWKKLFL